jgi:N-acetylmuramoyl-L-alanine amidase
VRPVLCLAVACLLALPAFADEEAGGLVVVLDPGHGGRFPHDGAHGRRGLIEKNISLAVAQKTKELLESAGATVVLTREKDEDISLTERARIANEAGADLFLSIHCNSMETRADRQVTRGVETFFLSPDPTDAEARMLAELENGGPGAVPLPKAASPVEGILNDLALGQARNDSAALARLVQNHVIKGTRATSRGVKQAPLVVLSGTRMPSVLVEIGFISHAQEGRLLGKPKYQARVAQALAEAVRDFADKVLARRLFAKAPAAPAPDASASPAASASAAAPAPAASASAAAPAPAEPASAQPAVNATGVVASPGGTR